MKIESPDISELRKEMLHTYMCNTCTSILLVFPWQQVHPLSNQVSHSREHPCESIHVYLINLINLQLRSLFSPHQFLLEISLLAFQLRDLSYFDSLRKLQYLVLPTKWIQQCTVCENCEFCFVIIYMYMWHRLRKNDVLSVFNSKGTPLYSIALYRKPMKYDL